MPYFLYVLDKAAVERDGAVYASRFGRSIRFLVLLKFRSLRHSSPGDVYFKNRCHRGSPSPTATAHERIASGEASGGRPAPRVDCQCGHLYRKLLIKRYRISGDAAANRKHDRGDADGRAGGLCGLLSHRHRSWRSRETRDGSRPPWDRDDHSRLQGSRHKQRFAPVRSAYYSSLAAQLRHSADRLGERPCLLRLDRHTRMAYPWSCAAQQVTFCPLARRSDTPTRATARARKEPTGSLPSWLMSDSQ